MAKDFWGTAGREFCCLPSFLAAGVAVVTAQIITLERVAPFGYLETFKEHLSKPTVMHTDIKV